MSLITTPLFNLITAFLHYLVKLSRIHNYITHKSKMDKKQLNDEHRCGWEAI